MVCRCAKAKLTHTSNSRPCKLMRRNVRSLFLQKATAPSVVISYSAGNIAKWNKKEGDEIAAGDSIAEIETDKATMDWEAQDDGFVAKILAQEGAKDVSVGSPVIVIVEEEVNNSPFGKIKAFIVWTAIMPTSPLRMSQHPQFTLWHAICICTVQQAESEWKDGDKENIRCEASVSLFKISAPAGIGGCFQGLYDR